MSTPGTPNYPTSLNDADSLMRTVNNVGTTLNGAINNSVTSITLTDASSFPTSGAATIGNTAPGEIVYWTGKSSNTLTGVVRGQDGTSAVSHSDGEAFNLDVISRHHMVLAEAIVNLETKVGIGADTPVSGDFFKGTNTGESGWSALTSGEVTTALGYTPVNPASNNTFTGINTFTPGARSSGTANYLTVNQPADTGITAGSEGIGIRIVSATRQHASNTTVATQREVLIEGPTYSFATSGGTITAAVTFETSSPIQGTNATLTKSIAARFVASAAAHVPIVAMGASSQSGNLQEWQNSSGTVLASMSSAGALTLGAGLAVGSGGTGLTSGTSGGVPYFSGSTTITSSAALTADQLIAGGGAGNSPKTYTTGSTTALIGTGSIAVATLAGLAVALNGNTYISASDGTRTVFMGADSGGSGILGTLSNHDFLVRANNTNIAVLQAADTMINELNSYKRVTSQFDKTDATLANITGLSVTVAAGKTYYFEAVLHISNSSVNGWKTSVAGTATATAVIYNVFTSGSGASPTVTCSQVSSLGGATSAGNAIILIVIKGLITVNAGGTLTVQFAESTASGTASVLVGSTWLVKPVN